MRLPASPTSPLAVYRLRLIPFGLLQNICTDNGWAEVFAGPLVFSLWAHFICHTHTHTDTNTLSHTHSNSRPFGCIIKFLSDSFRGVDEGVARCGMLMNSPGEEHAPIMHPSTAEPTR